MEYNVHPNNWHCVTNLKDYPCERWIYFSDLSDEAFVIIWDAVDRCANLIVNDDWTAFKKVKYAHTNKLYLDIFYTS